jgi:hypothetical protein
VKSNTSLKSPKTTPRSAETHAADAADEQVIAGLRCIYRHATADGIITEQHPLAQTHPSPG